MKDEYLKIKEELKINNIYNNIDYIIEGKFIKIDKYKEIINFSDLFNKRARRAQRPYVQAQTFPGITIGKPTSTSDDKKPKVDSVPSVPADSSTLQGKSYDASQMWSPKSRSGVIYEWNRGVIGIGIDGEVVKEKLDGTYNHHADATYRVAESLGIDIAYTAAPFEAALNASSEGALILQFEGDTCFAYFPPSISTGQLDQLIGVLTPRSNFVYSFTHGDQIFDDDSINYQKVIDFAVNLSMSAEVRR